MTAKKVVKEFDQARLQQMREPLTIRVEKKKASGMQPISLPGKGDGVPPGTGWGRDDVLVLESYVRDQLSGGGWYEAKVTDADGNTMQWPFGWDPRTWPERVPPDAQASAVQTPMGPPPGPGQFIPPAPDPMSASAPLGGGSTGWLPHYGAYPYAQQQPAYQQPTPWNPPAQTTPWASWGTPPAWGQAQAFGGFPGFGVPSNAAFPGFGGQPPGAEPTDRMRSLEERLQKAERDNLQKDYQSALERQHNESAAAIKVLQDELRRLGERRSGDEDAESRRHREENERLRRQQELDALKTGFQAQVDALKSLVEKVAESGKSGQSEEVRTIREEMRRAEDRNDRERQEQRHREELRAIQEAANKGPDPMVEYLKENSRMAAETSRENARSQQAIADRLTQVMISPVQLSEMLQRQSTGMDTMLQNVISIMGSGFETYRAMMESIIQAGGAGPSPGFAMAQEGLQRFSEIANKYITYQRDKAVHEATAKAATARSQAEAARAAQAQAQMYQNIQQGVPGAPVGEPPSEARPAEPVVEGGNGQRGEAKPAEVIDINERRPPTEEEMFGAAVEAVQHLRRGVADGKMDPEQVIYSIMQGIAMADKEQVRVPAFDLLLEGRFADLMDVLLPQAPQPFRDECAQILASQFQVAAEEFQAEMEEEEEPDS